METLQKQDAELTLDMNHFIEVRAICTSVLPKEANRTDDYILLRNRKRERENARRVLHVGCVTAGHTSLGMKVNHDR